MANQSKPKSCSSQTGAGHAAAEVGCGARRRLGRRVAAAKVRVAHDYIDTLNAARRRKHPDKQERLIIELRAMLGEMKAALQAAVAANGASAPVKAGSRGKRR
jgi:hypothetical protein